MFQGVIDEQGRLFFYFFRDGVSYGVVGLGVFGIVLYVVFIIYVLFGCFEIEKVESQVQIIWCMNGEFKIVVIGMVCLLFILCFVVKIDYL